MKKKLHSKTSIKNTNSCGNKFDTYVKYTYIVSAFLFSRASMECLKHDHIFKHSQYERKKKKIF